MDEGGADFVEVFGDVEAPATVSDADPVVAQGQGLTELAGVLDTTVGFLFAGNADEAVPLHRPRLLDGFRDLVGFEPEDQEAVIKLINAMILKHRVEGAVGLSS